MNFTYDDADQLASLYDGQNNQIRLIKNSENQVSQAQLLNPDGSVAQEKTYDLNSHPNNDPVLSALKNTPSTPNDAVGNIARPDLQGLSALKLYNLMQSPKGLDWATPLQAKNTDLDSQNRTTSYFYNDFGEVVKVHSPVTGITTYQYNESGLIIGQQRQDGSRSLYTRDAAQRVVEIKSLNAQQQIDEHGKVLWGKYNKPSSIQFKAGEERFSYNENAQLLKHELFVDGQRFNIAYAFNKNAQLVGRTLPDGQELEYQYRTKDEARAGLLASIHLKRGPLGLISQSIIENLNSAKDTSVNYGYQFGNGLEHREVLDKQGRMITSGNVNTGETTLDYLDDQSNEPTQVSYHNKTYLGTNAPKQFNPTLTNQVLNLFDRSPSASVKAIPVSGSDHLNYKDYLKTAQYGAEYDQLGRKRWVIENDKVLFFSYDSIDRLVKVEYLKPNEQAKTVSDYVTPDVQLSKHTLAEYKYNLFGQRIQKTVATTTGKGTKTTYYFYDGSQLVAEADDQGKVEKSYIWMNQIPVAMIDHDELFYIHVDHRQAPISVTNSQRKVVWQAELSDYLYASPLAYNHGRLGSIEFNLRGSNQYFDAETNLHYNTNRYFDAKNEKYITPDPLGLAVGPDLYAFGLRQPHSINDPLGLAPKLVTDNQVKNASFNQKVQDIILRAVPQLPSIIGNALLEMVQPANLAIMGTILGVWAVAQATPAGWLADLALLGYSIYTLGSGIIDLYKMFVNLNNDAKCAKNINDLNKAANRLAHSLVTSTGEIVGGLTGIWGIKATDGFERIAQGLETVSAYGKRQVAKVSINILKLTIKRPDTKNVKYPKDMSKWM